MESKTSSALRFPLYTRRLIIRPFSMSDLEGFHAIFGDPQVMAHIPSGVSATMDDSAVRLKRIIDMQDQNGLSLWAVVDQASGRVIGDCGFFPVERIGPEIEIAYHFSRDSWGNGYATEAAQACLHYGFATLKLKRILALVKSLNIASVRVIEKSGMVYQGPGRYYNQDLEIYAAESSQQLQG